MTTEAMQICFFSLFDIFAIIAPFLTKHKADAQSNIAFKFYFEQIQNKCMSCQKQCYCNKKQSAHEAT